LATLPRTVDPNLLVGIETSDDAGVYLLTAEMALVVTADFITPPVDDPHLFGQVAAVNAINDIYAMGARPVTAYNLVGFPSKQLSLTVLSGILAGALTKIQEAGAVLAGGHTVENDEPMFGLSVNGLVHPGKIWRNSTAQVGDRLVLTKPLGSGVLFNANRAGKASARAMKACLDQVTILNKGAAEVLSRFTVHACTDVTGFGLAGHAFEMSHGAGLTFAIAIDTLPLLDEALDMYRRKVTTGANANNREYVERHHRFECELPAWHREIVYDPQTAGGLLAALPADQAEPAAAALRAAGLPHATVIGEVRPMQDVHLIFR
jgi:selenide,water dikinase